MLKGIGTDIVSIERVRNLNRQEDFAKRILSDEELFVYVNFTNDTRRVEYLAGRFAAKEAMSKIGILRRRGASFTDFIIINDETGAPRLLKPKIDGLHLSISHDTDYAVAFVVLE